MPDPLSPARTAFAARTAEMIATVGHIGYLPGAPGTWASIAALPPAALLMFLGGSALLLAATALLAALALWSGRLHAELSGHPDPPSVVIDEFVGQWIALLPLALDPFMFALALVVFRLIDITKPWPIAQAERLHARGLAILLDDVTAGCYAALVLMAVKYWL